MNANSFTYGFEIEGVFKKTLINDLRLKWSCDTKRDGSVRYQSIQNRVKNLDTLEYNCQEINVGIFKKQSEMFDALKMVTGRVHFHDKSCGLHLHIKPKRDLLSVQARIIDMKFLAKVENFAYTKLCKHVKSRKNNQYCSKHKGLKKTYKDFREEEKYRFIRLHPRYGTFEMRFFSPCEHKTKNIKTFLDFFIMELNKVETKKESNFKIKDVEHIMEAEVKHDIELNSGKTLNFTHVINKRTIIGMLNQGSNRYWQVMNYASKYKMPKPIFLSSNHIRDCHCSDECVDDRIENDSCHCQTCDDRRDDIYEAENNHDSDCDCENCR